MRIGTLKLAYLGHQDLINVLVLLSWFYGAHGPARILLMAMLALNLSANLPAIVSQVLPPAILVRHTRENHLVEHFTLLPLKNVLRQTNDRHW